MPVSDNCQLELNAYLHALTASENVCTESIKAALEWGLLAEEAQYAEEDCKAGLGPRPEIPDGAEAPLIHIIEQEQEEYDQNLADCFADELSAVNEAESLYDDLNELCESFREEEDAIHDEYEVCLHELNEGIPFA